MKKIIYVVSILVVGILLTGCGNNKNVVLSCKSEIHGENPTITSYEVYTIENGKVTGMEAYDFLDYEDSYLKNITIDQIIEIQAKDTDYTVTKVDGNSIKRVKNNPFNVFENTENDNIVEFVRNTMEENEFAPYDYTCEVK